MHAWTDGHYALLSIPELDGWRLYQRIVLDVKSDRGSYTAGAPKLELRKRGRGTTPDLAIEDLAGINAQEWKRLLGRDPRTLSEPQLYRLDEMRRYITRKSSAE